jgi:hypothetical protein
VMMRADAVPYRPSPKLGFQIITELWRSPDNSP